MPTSRVENPEEYGPLPKLHPRESPCRQAKLDIAEAIQGVVEKYDLTTAEQLSIVNAACSEFIGCIAKYEIRAERHPRDPDKPGGWE